MGTRLHNLDELLLTVRDATTRVYLNEVVSAHRVGANRAAIVSLWTTIVYDLVQKIRELAYNGEAAATAFVTRYETARAHNNIPALLAIEEEIVEVARRDFEMLQAYEATALLRIREDRHLCAHPAMTSDDRLFQPTADLVQAYITHAVVYLLAHQPIQGKSALARIYNDITSPSFPADSDLATRFLAERYLRRAKSSLIRNLTIVVVKKHIGQNSEREHEAFSLALEALVRTRPDESVLALKEQVPRLGPATPLDRILNVLALVDVDPRCWDWCDDAFRIQVRGALQQGSHYERYTPRILRGVAKIDELAPLLTEGFEKLDDAQKLRLTKLRPRAEYIRPMIRRYAEATSWRDAGSVGENAIVPLAPLMSADDLIEVIRVAQGNGQVNQAHETLSVLNSVFDLTIAHLPKTRPAWHAFVSERAAKEGSVTAMYAYPDLAKRLAASLPEATSA